MLILVDQAIAGDLATPEELLRGVAADVPAMLAEALTGRDEFAQFEDRWLPRDLLAEVHVGHLNIAEALIELRNAPLDTDALLKEIELPAELSYDIATFSLQSVLEADGRFDQVGPGDKRMWYLKRLEPAEAMEMPASLRYVPIAYDKAALSGALQQLEWDLDDEWSVAEVDSSGLRPSTPSADHPVDLSAPGGRDIAPESPHSSLLPARFRRAHHGHSH